MTQIGIFYGSDTGNTEAVAAAICQELGANCSGPHDIAKSTQGDLERFDQLLVGIPTWYYGEAQCDWDDFFPTLEKINFQTKQVAIFGCGDQEDYAEYFCDAMGRIADTLRRQGANLVGQWPIAGYFFEASKALADGDHFVGLAIDEDRQPELTAERIKSWVQQVRQEMGLGSSNS